MLPTDFWLSIMMCFCWTHGVGCTHSTEHMIKVMDDTPFKE